MDYVHSRQNPVVKHLIKLASLRRERVRSRQSILIGTHLIEAALQANFKLQHVFVRDGDRSDEVLRLIEASSHFRQTTLSGELFDAIDQMPSHTGILALFEWPEAAELSAASGALLLEDIQDPGNVGSILRTVAASSVRQVWLTKGCADIWSPKVLRAAMGAHFVLDIVDGLEIADIPADIKLAVTVLDDSKSLYEIPMSSDLVFALGTEGAGISEELRERAHLKVRIPMSGRVESLNVAATAAICIFERERQLLPGARNS